MISTVLSIREADGHLVVTLRGELDAVDAADAEAALARAAAGIPRVVADLAALEFLDCCGLGVLIRVRAQARQAGGDLLLAAPGQQVRRLLALTGMTGVLCVHASVDEAVLAAGWPRSGACLQTPAPAATILLTILRWRSMITSSVPLRTPVVFLRHQGRVHGKT